MFRFGVPGGTNISPEMQRELERHLGALGETPEGQLLLEHCFRAQSFEEAPPVSYRALYRLAQS